MPIRTSCQKKPQPIPENANTLSNKNEIRRFMYSIKILGIFWFDGILPDNITESIDYVINPNWHNGLSNISTHRIDTLSESELIFICKKIKKPRWVARSCLRGRISFTSSS